MNKEPHLNYLGYPIAENAHFGTFAELRDNKLTYLARTCQATFNVVAVLNNNFGQAWHFNLLKLAETRPELVQARKNYDATFRTLYRSMEEHLPNGMTLREGSLTLRPQALFAQLQEWKPDSQTLTMVLEVIRSMPECRRAAATAEAEVGQA